MLFFQKLELLCLHFLSYIYASHANIIVILLNHSDNGWI